MKYTPFFERKEFACKCGCGFDTVDVELLDILINVREHFGAPIIINSGCRCAEHNAKVGGAKKSKHVFGQAADIRIAGPDSRAQEIYDYLDSLFPDSLGLGIENRFCHVDIRKNKSRWTY